MNLCIQSINKLVTVPTLIIKTVGPVSPKIRHCKRTKNCSICWRLSYRIHQHPQQLEFFETATEVYVVDMKYRDDWFSDTSGNPINALQYTLPK